MRIGIDCRLAGIQNAGIGRYIEELVREVTKDTSITWVLFFQKTNQLEWLKADKHIRIVIAPIRHYTIQEQLVMPYIFGREKLDLLHVPHFNVPLLYIGPFVVTIHDLLWHDQRGKNMTTLSPVVYSLKYAAYKYVSALAIKRAKAIFVPAHTVKETLRTHIDGLNQQKIHVTYEGLHPGWFTAPKEKKIEEKEKILFYTGSLYPHKNVMLVVQALSKLPGYHLYISSARSVFVDDFMKSVREVGMGPHVTHLGCLSDDELRSWYARSVALVQPSLSEGFGLTGIEAMATGLPVLASDIPIFREVYKDCFIPFDPLSEDAFIHAVHMLEKQSRSTLSRKSRELARGYSWEKMGNQTREIYASI